MYTQHTKFYFLFMSICMCAYTMCLHVHGCQRKTSDLLELELQVVVSHPMGTLEIEKYSKYFKPLSSLSNSITHNS